MLKDVGADLTLVPSGIKVGKTQSKLSTASSSLQLSHYKDYYSFIKCLPYTCVDINTITTSTLYF